MNRIRPSRRHRIGSRPITPPAKWLWSLFARLGRGKSLSPKYGDPATTLDFASPEKFILDEQDLDLLLEQDTHDIIANVMNRNDNPPAATTPSGKRNLTVTRVCKKRSELPLRDTLLSRANEEYELIDLALCPDYQAGKRSFSLMLDEFEFECELDEDTIILTGKNGVASKAIIKRQTEYIKCLDDPEKLTLQCRCLFSEELYSFFAGAKTPKTMVEYAEVFAKLSVYQQEFVLSMSKRPKIAENDGDPNKADRYTPIRDENALKMMYRLCRDTYQPSVRARIDGLLDQLEMARGGDRVDLINQISYLVGIDTTRATRRHKTYDEIIEIFDRHVYGMRELKIALAEFIIAMQFSSASYFAILLVGPPGVGKSSFSDAIVECMDIPLVEVDCSGANTVTMSGLFKTYGGAKAGKVMDAFLEQGHTDVLVLLDELDKMEGTEKGDPYGSLVKPLGPLRRFYDEFVASDTDVSCTKFFATANDITKIPRYIRNRFGSNIFTIDAYSVPDKAEIARNHLIPKKLAELHISPQDVYFDEEALLTIAREYCTDEGAREMSSYLTSLLYTIIADWSRGLLARPSHIDTDYVRAHLVKHNRTSERRIGY